MARLSWEAPTTNEDGSPLTDLSGYNVYIVDGGAGTSLGGTSELFMDINTEAYEGQTIECYVTALDTSGNESVPSVIASYDVPMLAPAAPTGLVIS